MICYYIIFSELDRKAQSCRLFLTPPKPTPRLGSVRRGARHRLVLSEGGMIRLETLIELKSLNSSFSSLSSY